MTMLLWGDDRRATPPMDSLLALGIAPVAWFSPFLGRAAWGSQPVIRCRRSTDQAERDFSATATFNGYRVVDGADLLDWSQGGSVLVTAAYDGMGSGLHAVQATAALQPPIVIAGVLQTLSGAPAINFAAVPDSRLVAPITPPITATIAVSNLINTVATQRSIVGSSTGAGTTRTLIRSRHWVDFGDGSLQPTVLAGVANIVLGSVSGPGAATISGRRAGVDFGPIATNRDQPAAGFVLGATSNATTTTVDGTCGDWVLINGASPLSTVGPVIGNLRGLVG